MTVAALLMLLLVALLGPVTAAAAADLDDDVYVADADAQCTATHTAYACVKAKALRYAWRYAGAAQDLALGDAASIVAVTPGAGVVTRHELLAWSTPRSADSEMDKFFKFGLRALERYAHTHALRLQVGDSVQVEGESEARGKKKKVALLLPLLLFLKLKALLVPTLLGVLFIKKVLVLAAVFLPAVLSLIKVCKTPQHHHGYHAFHSTGWAGPSGPAEHTATGVDLGGTTGYGGGGGGGHYAARKTLVGGRLRNRY